MRLEITRRTDLATRALLELARLDRRVKAAELADLIGTTPGFLSQALSPVAAKGWVRSEPGPTGGYVLVGDPEALSVLDVIEAVEGPTDTGACVLEDRPCGSGRLCALHTAWAGARAVLIEQLDGMSLASVPAGRRP